jgi:hypothetical protein
LAAGVEAFFFFDFAVAADAVAGARASTRRTARHFDRLRRMEIMLALFADLEGVFKRTLAR